MREDEFMAEFLSDLFENFESLGHDFRADAVAGDDRNAIGCHVVVLYK